MANSHGLNEQGGGDVAIIGMSGAFPGAKTVGQFWKSLCAGQEMVRFLGPSNDDNHNSSSRFVPAVAMMDDVDLFDATFFGIPPAEAMLTDPQHRILLEHAWSALEDAGYDSQKYQGSIGVFAGATINTYLLRNIASNRHIMRDTDPIKLNIGNGGDFLTSRISYKLNLKGPSHTVQSACSTSLVAVHCGCRSLLDFECDLALAGGVSVNMTFEKGYYYQEGSILSPDGHCRAFDAQARGTIFGSGVGVVVLKRLADALNDHDHIYAVIKGSAVNNDGSVKAGYTAPGVEGQTQVIVEALSCADVHPESIGYVECHGTGTPLGDPAEIRALTNAFRTATAKNGFCAVGSVKSNVGHLDAAAGITGLIKVVLMLKHGTIPPSLYCEDPNPAIDFDKSPFYVNTIKKLWSTDGEPRRAGVSAFGVGGTNAHVILEEAPEHCQKTADKASLCLLPLSARTENALRQGMRDLASYLQGENCAALEDIAYTLQVGRREFACRWAGVFSTREQAATVLEFNAAAGSREELQPELPKANLDNAMAALSSAQCTDAALEAALKTIANSWVAGASIDWRQLHRGTVFNRVSLPTYPFERQRFWIEYCADPGESSSELLPEPCEAQTIQHSPRPALRNSYVSPNTEAECKAIRILENALGIKPVGVTDLYGELGGDSLTAIKIIDQINTAFNCKLQIIDLYDGLTVRELLRLIQNGPEDLAASPEAAPESRRHFYQERRRALHQAQ